MRLDRGNVPADGIWPRRSVVEVQILIVQPHLLRHRLRLIEESLGLLVDQSILGPRVPGDGQQYVEETAVSSGKTERVTAMSSSFQGDDGGNRLEAEPAGDVGETDQGLYSGVLCALASCLHVGHLAVLPLPLKNLTNHLLRLQLSCAFLYRCVDWVGVNCMQCRSSASPTIGQQPCPISRSSLECYLQPTAIAAR